MVVLRRLRLRIDHLEFRRTRNHYGLFLAFCVGSGHFTQVVNLNDPSNLTFISFSSKSSMPYHPRGTYAASTGYRFTDGLCRDDTHGFTDLYGARSSKVLAVAFTWPDTPRLQYGAYFHLVMPASSMAMAVAWSISSPRRSLPDFGCVTSFSAVRPTMRSPMPSVISSFLRSGVATTAQRQAIFFRDDYVLSDVHETTG